MPDTKVVLITGASQGIGKAIAKRLAKQNYSVALLARNKEKLEQLSDELEKTFNISASVHPTDVSDKQAVKAAVQEVIEQHGRIDVLFNNAGIAFSGTSDIDIEKFEAMIKVNLLGAFYVLYNVIPQMKKQQSGYIFNLISRSAMVARPNLGGYAASKFGLRGFSESLYKELAPDGIKVTALHPGWVNTEMTQDVNLEGEKMIQPEDIAGLVEALLQLSQYAFVQDIVIEPLRIIELLHYKP